MGTNFATERTTYSTDRQDWSANKYGWEWAKSITLDLSLFNVDHNHDGWIPSGTVLGKVTASGKYGPYNPNMGGGEPEPPDDGRTTATGILLYGVKWAATGDVSAAMLRMGILVTAKLPNFADTANGIGELDADAITDLSPHFFFE